MQRFGHFLVSAGPRYEKRTTPDGHGWGEYCRKAVLAEADFWLEQQTQNPYRKVWYTPEHKYFKLMGWGSNGFRNIRWLTAAYALTGDKKYRDGALLGVNWMHGSNPQGRPYTTGIGHTPTTAVLQLSSYSSGGNKFEEVVPGKVKVVVACTRTCNNFKLCLKQEWLSLCVSLSVSLSLSLLFCFCVALTNFHSCACFVVI